MVLVCGIEAQARVSLENLQAQAQALVLDAVASPPKLSCDRLRKRTSRVLRGRGKRRKSFGSGSGPDDDSFFGGNDNGGIGNSGDSGNRGGGWSWSWNDGEESRKAMIISFFHQLACWIFLLHCLRFLFKSVVSLTRPVEYGDNLSH